MGYSRPMGFCMQIPAHRVGGPEKVWDTRGYGLSEVCVMTGSTVSMTPLLWKILTLRHSFRTAANSFQADLLTR